MLERRKLKHSERKALEMRRKMKSIPPEHLTAQSAKLVSVWLSLPAQTRSDASHTSFVWVMSDFLYATVTLHEDWLDHLYDLKMLEFTKYPSSPNERRLQRSELSDPQLAVVEMLFVAQDFVVGKLGKSPRDLISMVEFILKMESSPKPIDTILAHARGQEQLEKTCKPLYDAAFNYPKDGEPHSDIDMNLHEFTKSYDRRLMVAFLVTRALTSMIVKLGSTGETKVKEVEALAVETEEAIWCRQRGNEEFQDQNFDTAYALYTTAIESSKYSAVLYCNRCQTALKQKNYRLAISDGYRAIVLKPQWGKAYYRQAEAFREDGNIHSAFVCIQRGLQQSENEAETEELRKQQLKIEDLMRSDANLHELLRGTPNSESASQKKANKKKKAKKKNQKTVDREPLPPLLSDNDSMREISDDEIDVSEYFKPPSAKLTKYLNVLETVKSAQQENANEMKTTESVSDKEKTDSNSLISSTSEETKGINKETRNDVKTSGKDKATNGKEKNTKKSKEENQYKLFSSYRSDGSNALIKKDYSSALNSYVTAISCMEKLSPSDVDKISDVDRFLLIFSRAFACIEMRSPKEVAKALDAIATLFVGDSEKGKPPHPMIYYVIAQAQYVLNNFSMMKKPLTIGMKMAEDKKVKPLKWPGIDVTVPESNPNYLKDLMKDLLQVPQTPPKADAICFFDKCEKDDKNESYDLCEKEISRKEIYTSDLNFEGYMKVACSWDCGIFFHYKCWSKYKHNNFKKTGDKDILDVQCFTDSCKGFVSRIVMIDEKGNVKKDLCSDKVIPKEKDKKPPTRMSKNERNLNKRLKQIEAAKDKKHSSRQPAQVENVESPKPEKAPVPVRVFTEEDVANATVIKRKNENKPKRSKPRNRKTYNNMTLNVFLENSRNRQVNMSEIERVILSQTDDPFQIPEDLRDEIARFENELSDEEIFWTSCIYEYFENFFETKGPVKVQDDLLLQQQLLFSDNMKSVITKHNGIISLLCKNHQRFLVVPPYIGLPRQQSQMIQLADEFQKLLRPARLPDSVSSSSMLDTLDCDFDGPAGLSDFALDLYQVGDVPLSDVQHITGKQASVSRTTETEQKNLVYPHVITLSHRMDTPSKTEASSTSSEFTEKPFRSKGGKGDELDDFLCDEIDQYLLQDQPEASQSHVGSSGDGIYQSSEESSDFPSMSSVRSEPDTEPEVPDSLASESHISVANAETQVTLIPGYENELNNLREEKKNLESKIQDLSDRCTRIGMSAKTETAVLNKELDSTKVALESCQKQLKDLQTKKDNEAKKFAKERSSFQETEKKLRANLSEAESKRQDAEQKLKTKEADCDRLSRILQEQRSTWLEKSAETDREKSSLSSELLVLSKRALDAELKVIENEKNYALKTLLQAKNECEKITLDFEKLMQHYSSNALAQNEVLKGYMVWKSNIAKCTQFMEQTKLLFTKNSELLRNGKTLADLTEVQPLTPPSPGPTLQKVAAAAYRMTTMGSLNSSAAPVNQFQLGTSTTSLLGNGVDALSSGSSRMSPFSPSLPKQPSPVTTSSRFTPPPGLSQFTSSPIPNDSPASTQSKGSFEKIMARLQSSFPDASRTDLARCVKEVRENNNNSLTGLSIDDIINQASVIVTTKNLSRKSALGISNNPWGFNNPRGQTDDDPCVICQEPLRTRDIKKLKCNHSFHNACLNQWLERNRTCPTCRDFIIDKSQFPRLSAFSRR